MFWKHIIGVGFLFTVIASAAPRDWVHTLAAALPAIADAAFAATENEVRLEKQGGIYALPVQINGAITLKFILDSGASDVLIPADVFLTLMRTGTVSHSDFLDSQIYSLADGSKLRGARFIIRELRVGNQVATDVVASVGPVTGDLLLGLSFLSRFGTVTLDNDRHVLILSANASGHVEAQQRSNEQVAVVAPARPERPRVNNEEDNLQPPQRPGHARYRATACRSIIDQSTRLEWYIGPDLNMTWAEANKWVKELGACGGSWTMPSMDQLRALFSPNQSAGTGYYTRGRYWPAHIDPIFSQIGAGSWVWAGGTPDSQGAPSFNFNQGIGVRVSPTAGDYTVRVFAVRHATQ
jgi:clan AA aspartic protease (TIGR02281 family)